MPEHDEGRPGERAPLSSRNGYPHTVRLTLDNLGGIQRDALAEALLVGEAATHERAARRYEWARPRPGEWQGQRTREELRAKWRELTEIARACRARARVCDVEGIRADAATVLAELDEVPSW